MVFRELNAQEFDLFAKNYIPKTLYQTSSYGNTMISENFYSYYLGLEEDNKLVAATFVMVKTVGKFKYGYAPRGFLIDYNNTNLIETFTNEIKKFLGKKDVVAIKINPMIVRNIYDNNYDLVAANPNYETIYNNLKKNGYYHLGYNNYFESFKPRFEAIIEMNNNYIDLFQGMSKQFKTKVRSAENNGVRVYKGDFDTIDTLYNQAKNKYPRKLLYYQNIYKNLEANNMVDIYYAKLDTSVYLKVNQKIYLEQEQTNAILNEQVIKNKGNSHQKLINKKMEADKSLNLYHNRLLNSINLMTTNPDGIILATIMVAKVGDTINIVIDSFDRKFNTFNAKHLIIWKLIEKYSNEGYKYFNLGGLVHKVGKNDKFYGLNSFKLGFGSKVYEYLGDMELVTNKFLYLMYKNTANIFK